MGFCVPRFVRLAPVAGDAFLRPRSAIAFCKLESALDVEIVRDYARAQVARQSVGPADALTLAGLVAVEELGPGARVSKSASNSKSR
jgi:hypothetical protein